MNLGGWWAAAPADEALRRRFPSPAFDDDAWEAVEVPGHWQDVAAFAGLDGPFLYRRRFEHPAPAPGQRAWLIMDGVFYQSYVWLDGSYLGDTEGYFFPHAFEVTRCLADRQEHLLALEVACPPPAAPPPRFAITGVFGDAGCIDRHFNPGGIWAPVHLEVTGPVRLGSLRATCTTAGSDRALVDLVAGLDSAAALTAEVEVELRDGAGRIAAHMLARQPLAAGTNQASWQLEVPAPDLWWPRALGGQPLYDLTVTVSTEGAPSDRRQLRTGLRSVRVRDFVWRVNGERLFVKGANLLPTQRNLGTATPAQVTRDVEMAAAAGLDILRAHGHVGRPELYSAADRLGMLVWQDLPLQWRYANVRSEAVRQARAAVDLLGHHPSVTLWCGHHEPFSLAGTPGKPLNARWALSYTRAQLVPNADRSLLDRSLRRALRSADGSRPALPYSGVLPHPWAGSASHLYFGWSHGRAGGLANLLRAWPRLGRFVAELGAQAVPTEASFMGPEAWPLLDWDELEDRYCMQKSVFDQRVPPGAYETFEAWQRATQDYQAALVRTQVEALRLLKYRPTGGFAVSTLNDAQQAVSWSLLDHDRRPKPGFDALATACRPVLPTALWGDGQFRPGQRLDIRAHVVNDLRVALEGAELEACLHWPGGGRRWVFSGRVPADSCVQVGRLRVTLPHAAPRGRRGRRARPEVVAQSADNRELELELTLRWREAEPVVAKYKGSVAAR